MQMKLIPVESLEHEKGKTEACEAGLRIAVPRICVSFLKSLIWTPASLVEDTVSLISDPGVLLVTVSYMSHFVIDP